MRKMGEKPPPYPPVGAVTIQFLLPDGCVHVYGDYGCLPISSIVREADVPLDTTSGVHKFPEWL